MDFINEVKQFALEVQRIKEKVQTEEATKISIVMPFLQKLGYSVFDPHEVVPEYATNIPGIKKDERIDYAIFINNKLSIILEAKPINDLLAAHDSQLYKYFTPTTAKFAILTNGILYKFYSDTQKTNIMDEMPFFEFNLFDFDESNIEILKNFRKELFDPIEISNFATDLRYAKQIAFLFENELKEPSEDFIKFLIREIYPGKIMPSVIEKFKPLIKQTLDQYMIDWFNNKIRTAINFSPPPPPPPPEPEKIITTEQEREAFYLIKSLIRDFIDIKRISYKDTQTYFSVLIDEKVGKWICRLFLDGSKKYFILPSEDKEVKYSIEFIDDIYNYKNEIINIVKNLQK